MLNNFESGQNVVFLIIKNVQLFKEYVQFLNRLYDITCFGAVSMRLINREAFYKKH
jgi:hypothetical protein